MRVILSRKGFDSAYGRVPSPILPDGRMVSLPIPDKQGPAEYSAIRRDELSIGDLAFDLTRGRIRRDHKAHLDPDLDAGAVERRRGWRPLFGQQAGSLTHLRNQGVAVGDVFLFFGWFREAQLHDGAWRYAPRSLPVHAIWGWLSIGAVFPVRALTADVRAWAQGHPHLSGKRPAGNDLFAAADTLAVAGREIAGAGIFTSNPARVLTAPGETRSNWRLPAWFHPSRGIVSLSHNRKMSNWAPIDAKHCRLTSAAIGQEFVLETQDPGLLREWLTTLFSAVEAGGTSARPRARNSKRA